MRFAVVISALVGLVAANPMPQGVTSAISPTSSPGAGCMSSYSGSFEISFVNVSSSASSKKKRDNTLVATLSNGILHDEDGRTGYIASNYQFQFDNPPQNGAIYTAGWSICPGMHLALGSETTFYACLSGNPTGAPQGGYDNIYTKTQGAQCFLVYIDVMPTSGSSPSSQTGAVSQTTDGQPQGTPAMQTTDGQVQGTTGTPAMQTTDGQVQGSTGAPAMQTTDGQVQATTGTPAMQTTDGQVQGSTGAPAMQTTDGQVQATTGTPAMQTTDGQVQGSTGAPAMQTTDGQVQATTGAPAMQTTDGQVQATTGTAVPFNAAPTGTYGGIAAFGAFVAAVVAL